MKSDSLSNGTESSSSGYQFGTFKGVFTPSILTILGVVMYLRLGWVLGHVGLAKTLIIVTMSTAITFITGLSVSALATNRKVEGGGAYFIISRSLGIEAGAAVGLPLFFAQALGIAFYVAGFAESVCAIYSQYEPIHVGLVTLLAITIVAYISADLALKSQLVIMVAIFVSLVSFFLGSPTEIQLPDVTSLPDAEPFWIVFAVFFPAVTGILAGVAMSGDLKDPAKSLPKGTMGAIFVGYVVYMVLPVVLSFRLADTDILRHESMNMIMKDASRWGMPILLGLWAASLSSAVGSMLGAPRTLQALAKDRVIPRVFGRGFGKGNEPRLATATAFVIGLVAVLLGDLNVIAPVLSMFFLTTYGLLNISAGLEELAGPPSWRPTFRVPWFVSLFGAFGCFATMFMIDAGSTFIAAFVTFSVFFLMERRSMKARWGDMRSAILMMIAKYSINALSKRKPDERTWQPNILVLSGSPISRWYLIEMASAISRERGFLAVSAILQEDTPMDRIESLSSTMAEYLEKKDVSAQVNVYPAESPLIGAKTLVKTYGYGPITPNTILLGLTERKENYQDFSGLIRLISERRQNLVVVRESAEDEGQDEEKLGGDRIDIWWYGTQQNLGFMLAIAHLLKRGPGWRKAELVLKTIVNNPEERDESRQRLESFIDKVRIDAVAEVILRGESDIFQNIKKNSEGADLVFLGMRAPNEDESDAEYSAYYKDLVDKTDDLPPAAFVLAAEDMDFYKIFDS